MKIGPWRESQKPCTVSTSTVLPLAPAMARGKARPPSGGATRRSACSCIEAMARDIASTSLRLPQRAAMAAVSPPPTPRGPLRSSGPPPLRGPPALAGPQGPARALRAVEPVHARADAHLHPVLDLQRDQRLAHRRPAHAQSLGQVALGRQPRTGIER